MWQAFIDFMLNIMMYLYQVLGNNFLFALVTFTVLTRVIMLPLNLRQQRSTIRMQEMQPQVQAIQKKYRDNQQKMMEEFNKIGYSPTEPLMGCLPLLVQMPIFLALFRVINTMLESTPQALLTLKSTIDPSFDLANLLPIDNTFLWMNLSQPDPYLVLPLLVAGSMFISQKLMMPQKNAAPETKGRNKKGAEQDDPAAQMQKSMQYTMPIMFGFFALSFNSGLGIYFVVSNLIGMAQGYFVRRSMAQARAESEVRRKANIEAAAKLEDGDDDLDSPVEKKKPAKQNVGGNKGNKSKSKKKKGK